MKSSSASSSDSSIEVIEYEWERCWNNRRKLRRNRSHGSECECGSDEDDIFELEDLERRLRRLKRQLKDHIDARRKPMHDCTNDNEDEYQYVGSETILSEENEHDSSLCEIRSLRRRIHALRQRIDQRKVQRASNPHEKRLHEARVMLHRMRAGLSANDEEWQKILDNLEDDIEADEQYTKRRPSYRTSTPAMNQNRPPNTQTIWLVTSESELAHQPERTKVFNDAAACQKYVSSSEHRTELIVSGKHTDDKKLIETLYNASPVLSIRQLNISRDTDEIRTPKLLLTADRQRTIIIFLTPNDVDAQILKFSKQLNQAADSIIIFDNAVDCFDYIATTTGCAIAVIVIDDYANDWKILTTLNECPPVSIIYRRIYDQGQQSLIDEQTLTTTCPKLRGSFIESNPLRHRIAVDLPSTQETFSVFGSNNIERSVRDLDKEEVIFLWYQIMIDLIRSFPVTDETRTDFLTECRKQCISNNQRLVQIDDFQSSYLAAESLRWYTKQTCFFQIVNEALRKQNAKMIHSLRLFISDLSAEILRKRDLTINYITLYRGQLIHNDEINRIHAKHNGLIAFNSFLSTSSLKDVAEAFGGCGVEPDAKDYSFLILEIEATTDICCNLVNDTVFKEENEYLIMPATIFKIVSFQLTSPRSYYAKLRYTTDEDLSGLNLVKTHFERKIRLHDGPTILAWGRYLYHVGEYNAAKEYYLTLLDQHDHSQLQLFDTIENDLAQVFFRLGLYNEAHEHQKRALLRIRTLPIYSDALKNYLQALDIETRQQQLKKGNLARIYSNIGMVYNNMQQFIMALTYFRHAFGIQRHISLDNSTDLAATCNNIGIVYTNIGEHKLAHKYYSEAFSISLRSLPHDHPSVQMYLKNRDIYLIATSMHDNKKPFFIEMLHSLRRNSDASIDDIEIMLDTDNVTMQQNSATI
ncbi:hypothetical protein I4U23_004541 [Adineta vaga]|nr:hypothetical protein I4U23_004541 [Adineta vaga]